MTRLHTDTTYEAELSELREQVLAMSAMVEKMFDSAIQAFREKNQEQAAAALEMDRHIDQFELDIDNLCLRILACRQPVASDLRFIATTMKAVTDLERIGDLAGNISERVMELGSTEVSVGVEQIQEMSDVTRSMLRDALDAFVNREVRRAEGVRERDRRVDDLYVDLFPLTLQAMADDPGQADAIMRVLSMGKYIERVADHATNLAEMVVFMIEGEDVRHLGAHDAAGG